jgi:hypothetical protein
MDAMAGCGHDIDQLHPVISPFLSLPIWRCVRAYRANFRASGSIRLAPRAVVCLIFLAT